jgi:hypothetical protein
MSVTNNCSSCGACGCGVALYLVNQKKYCRSCLPKSTTTKTDDQMLTPEQRAKLNTVNVLIQP